MLSICAFGEVTGDQLGLKGCGNGYRPETPNTKTCVMDRRTDRGLVKLIHVSDTPHDLPPGN
jgi:hypothetical protein